VVVQVGEWADDRANQFLETPREALFAMSVYEGLIDTLDVEGLIDHQRVGILGYPRSKLQRFKLRGGDSEYALDVRQVFHTDLDVSLFVEARRWIYTLAFEEDTSNRVKRLPFVAFVDGVNVIDHRAVQIPLQ